jgi:hypothetical protein
MLAIKSIPDSEAKQRIDEGETLYYVSVLDEQTAYELFCTPYGSRRDFDTYYFNTDTEAKDFAKNELGFYGTCDGYETTYIVYSEKLNKFIKKHSK